jgi:periplasmic divalent cation tolerance protein
MEPCEVEVSCPDAESARAVARAAVEAGLAACGWVIPGVEAVYRWQGAVEAAPEVVLRLKTRADLFPPLCDLIRARHPYDLPAIVALPVLALGPGVSAWWEKETGAPVADAPARGC